MPTSTPPASAEQTSFDSLVDSSPQAGRSTDASAGPPAKPAKLSAAERAAAREAKLAQATADKAAKQAQAAAAKQAKQEQAAAAKAAREQAAALKAGSRKASKTPTLLQALTSFLEGPLLADLTARAAAPAVDRALREQWQRERDAGRSAEHFEGFRQRIALQIGASWLLACVFVRTLEDRNLLARRRLAGDGADDSERLFVEQFPSLGTRDYLFAVFREVGKLPGAAPVLGPGNAPAYRLGPSSDVARDLLKLFRRTDDAGALLYRFDGDDTRLLGDIYQNLSAEIRERYALLQTPDFVEAFILSRTLTPALATFGLEQVRLLDPTCGSGHFLLGAFHLLANQWRAHSPGLPPAELARKALAQVHGVDLNPYAVAIARFRLTLAFLHEAGMSRLSDIHEELPLNLVVADSLLIAARKETRHFHEAFPDAGYDDRLFQLEDPQTAYRLLGQGYHAVVGNPPYITCKDSELRETYRKLYDSAAGKYALAAPFTERFFELGAPGGYVGLINANSFMKREFGKKLIENVLPGFDLTHVIDTAGAFIPGHGTPTVILFGRNQRPVGSSARAVLGKRGEPSTPEDPAKGLVWTSIVQHLDQVEFDNDFVSVVDMERKTLAKHPWSLGGGGAAELKELLEGKSEKCLSNIADSIGISCVTGEDDLYVVPADSARRLGLESTRLLVTGEAVRDWSCAPELVTFFPYDSDMDLCNLKSFPRGERLLWPARVTISQRKRFGVPMLQKGLAWYELQELYRDKLRTPLSIVFAEVATHNHFVLDRGGKVFKQTAPIIKLPAGATEDEHLALLGYLNSSTACFWMKQVFFPKYGAVKSDHPDPARNFYQMASNGLRQLPVPPMLGSNQSFLDACRELNALGEERSHLFSGDAFVQAIRACASAQQVESVLEGTWARWDASRRRSVHLQEEIDWFIYSCFGLADESLAPMQVEPELELTRGQRAFEPDSNRYSLIRKDGHLLLASQAEVETAPPTVLSAERKSLRQKRREATAASSSLALIETNVFKRLWRDVETNEAESDFRRKRNLSVCEKSLLEELERIVFGSASPVSISSLLSELESTRAIVGVRELLERQAQDLVSLALSESVPYLAALRHTDSGLEKRRVWEETWSLQRREDAGEKLEVPVPPKYDSKDYRKAEYWSLRGKLDVPKERFISYPGAEVSGEGVVLGWAGWNHLQRAQALAGLYQDRKEQQGWEGEKLVPLLAGLWELVPWLRQWHNEPDEAFGGERLGDYFAAFVTEEARLWGKTPRDLEAWRPAGR